MIECGWRLEPSAAGPPSKRFWEKVKKVAEAMRACRAMDPSDLINASPVDGPDGDPPPRDLFGRWISSAGNRAFPQAGTPSPPTPSPARFGQASSPLSNVVPEPTPSAVGGGDSRVNEVLMHEEFGLCPLPWRFRLRKNNYGQPLRVAAPSRIQLFRRASRMVHLAMPEVTRTS